MWSRSTRRVAVLYLLAWSPFVALYTFAFSTGDDMTGLRALRMSLYYTGPPALLGVGVIRACVAMPWSSSRRGWFFLGHVGLAVLFAAFSGAGTVLCFELFPVYFEELPEGQVTAASIFTSQLFFGVLLYGLLVGFTYAAIGESRRRQEAAAAARAEALRAQAELKALRAQVNPHFLFNTLHSLLALVRSNPRAAEDALEQFGDLMRYSLRVQQETDDRVPLAEEWAFARDYLALEKLRLGDRLQVHTDIDDEALSCVVPALSLQPLLENSIGHAIAPRAGGGNVWIRAVVSGGRLRLEVRDDGPGASEAAIEASGGTGLQLLRRRLDALHGDAATVTTSRTDDEGFSVIVELPAVSRVPTEKRPER